MSCPHFICVSSFQGPPAKRRKRSTPDGHTLGARRRQRSAAFPLRLLQAATPPATPAAAPGLPAATWASAPRSSCIQPVLRAVFRAWLLLAPRSGCSSATALGAAPGPARGTVVAGGLPWAQQDGLCAAREGHHKTLRLRIRAVSPVLPLQGVDVGEAQHIGDGGDLVLKPRRGLDERARGWLAVLLHPEQR